MKKRVFSVFALAFLVGTGACAQAVDFKAGGSFEMGYFYSSHTHFTNEAEDRFDAATRVQLRFDAIANENLRGVYQMRVGTTSWGRNGGNGTGPGSGWGIGSQGVNIRTLEAYLDFRWPGTNLNLRMGLFPIRAPQAVHGKYSGSMIMDERAAGVEAVYTFTPSFSLMANWGRLWNKATGVTTDNANRQSKMDLLMLAAPVKTGVVNATPWGMYAQVGKNVRYSVGDQPYFVNSTTFAPNLPDTMLDPAYGKKGKIWWGGLALYVTALENWILKADVIYGHYKADYDGNNLFGRRGDPRRAGWLADFQLGYKLDHFTPTFLAFYSTGDKESDLRNNSSGRIPVLSNLSGWTSLGGMNSLAATSDGVDRKLMVAQDYTGMWGVMLALEDIKFIEKLTSTIRVLYMRGTNDNQILRDYARGARGRLPGAASPWYLGKSDSAWEFNFNHEYKLYENLGLWVETGYIILDRSHANEPRNGEVKTFTGNTDGHSLQSRNAYSIFTGFYYRF